MAVKTVTTTYDTANQTVSYTLGYVPKYKGNWSTGVVYHPSNIVRYAGKCYICKTTEQFTSTISPLNDKTNWDVLAEDTSTGSIKSITVGGITYVPEAGSDAITIPINRLGVTVNGQSPDATGNISVDVAKTQANTSLDDNTNLLVTTAYLQRQLDNYVETKGDNMSGPIVVDGQAIKASDSSHSVTVSGSSANNTGASITVYGKDSSNSGQFIIQATNGSQTQTLNGAPDGTLSWGGATVLTSSTNVDASKLTGTGAISITGNAASADKLKTARTIGISGAATGTATSFNGTANITIPVTSLDASKLTGTASVNTTGKATTAGTADTAKACTGNAATATKISQTYVEMSNGTRFWVG